MVTNGVRISQIATGNITNPFYFLYHGSYSGNRPGLRRSDTARKAIASGFLLRAIRVIPVILVTTHLPERGTTTKKMLQAAIEACAIYDIICIHDVEDVERLQVYREAENSTQCDTSRALKWFSRYRWAYDE